MGQAGRGEAGRGGAAGRRLASCAAGQSRGERGVGRQECAEGLGLELRDVAGPWVSGSVDRPGMGLATPWEGEVAAPGLPRRS